jgi:hypothetical protein
MSLPDRARAVLRALRLVFSLVTVLALLYVVAMYVWPTPWRYDHMTYQGETVIVRMDRMTGDAEMLLPDQGWVPMGEADGADPNDVQGAS